MATLAVLNLPLGYLRKEHDPFTFGWCFYVSISLPVVVYLRVKTGYQWGMVPLLVGGAMVGQMLGGHASSSGVKAASRAGKPAGSR
jgi:hypothetical protein